MIVGLMATIISASVAARTNVDYRLLYVIAYAGAALTGGGVILALRKGGRKYSVQTAASTVDY